MSFNSPTRSRPLLLGHRGARAGRRLGMSRLGGELPAENTMAAFNYAMARGCDGFEFDVRYTRDRRSVLCHDADINQQEVAATEYAGLERRCDYPLASLEDVLQRFGPTAYLDIELKVHGHE